MKQRLNSYLNKIDVPNYSINQERFNSLSHFLGVPIALFVFVYSLYLFISNKVTTGIFVGLIIYSFTILVLYLASALYHIENPAKKAKKIKRIIDHCTIYLLIAGTYTPIALFIYQESYMGLIILLLEWFFAVVGIVFNAIDLTNKYIKAYSMFSYLFMGWMIVFLWSFKYLPEASFLFILGGGIAYTLGSILYGFGRKNANFHCVFHVFDLVGTILQAIGVLLLFVSK